MFLLITAEFDGAEHAAQNASRVLDRFFAAELDVVCGHEYRVSAFFADGRDEHVIRFCFAKNEATLAAACARLAAL